jgi:hypothetical protein
MKLSSAITTLSFATFSAITAPLASAAESGWYIGANGGESQSDVDGERIAAGLLSQGFGTTYT